MKYGVGIDVSKGKSTIAILSIEGEVIEMPFDIIFDTIGIVGGLIIALVCVVLAQLTGIYWTQNYWRAIYFIDD